MIQLTFEELLGSVTYRARNFSHCPNLSLLFPQFMRWWQLQEMSGELGLMPMFLLLSLENLGSLPRLISRASEYLGGNVYPRGLFFSNFYCILTKDNTMLKDAEGITLKGILGPLRKFEFFCCWILPLQIPCKPAFPSVGGNACSDPYYASFTLARCGDTCFS